MQSFGDEHKVEVNDDAELSCHCDSEQGWYKKDQGSDLKQYWQFLAIYLEYGTFCR